MFDPAGTLARDPANIDFALTAMVDVNEQLGSEMAFDQSPIVPKSVEIERLDVDAVGAALAAQGAFDFIMEGFQPVPVGQATVEVSGINQLMTALTEIGVLTSGDLLPVRMMLGVFMQPTRKLTALMLLLMVVRPF